MIKLEIDSKDYDLDDDLKSRIVDRIGGLDEYMDTLDEGNVTIAWKGGPHEQTKVSAEVWGGGNRFDASATDWKPVTAIDQTREKLYAQIRKEHGKDLSTHDRHRKQPHRRTARIGCSGRSSVRRCRWTVLLLRSWSAAPVGGRPSIRTLSDI